MLSSAVKSTVDKNKAFIIGREGALFGILLSYLKTGNIIPPFMKRPLQNPTQSSTCSSTDGMLFKKSSIIENMTAPQRSIINLLLLECEFYLFSNAAKLLRSILECEFLQRKIKNQISNALHEEKLVDSVAESRRIVLLPNTVEDNTEDITMKDVSEPRTGIWHDMNMLIGFIEEPHSNSNLFFTIHDELWSKLLQKGYTPIKLTKNNIFLSLKNAVAAVNSKPHYDDERMNFSFANREFNVKLVFLGDCVQFRDSPSAICITRNNVLVQGRCMHPSFNCGLSRVLIKVVYFPELSIHKNY